MKLTLLLLALSIGISAEAPKTTFFGDRSKGEFYPVACSLASSIASENWIIFDSCDDAERRGFQFAPCPVDPRVAKVKPVKAANRAWFESGDDNAGALQMARQICHGPGSRAKAHRRLEV